MNKTIVNGLTGIVLALSAASCDSGTHKPCGALNSQEMKGMYNEATYSSVSYNSTRANADNEPKCRDVCTYKPEVGCCWCPD